ncbi:TauD/TfdA family dioxygenase [Pigmentiphaga soli]|uniref:TauD/TfdA family dioxygenase n=1 Tax=Pigmentiphaga soli TaxID=1007095 RepID=A0ABP8GD30_9BURK
MTDHIKPLEGPSVWHGADLLRRTDWIETLAQHEIDEILAAAQAAADTGLDLFDIRKEHFPLPRLAERLAAITRKLEDGPGLLVIRGLPAASMTAAQIRYAYWGIGLHMGIPVSQSGKGELMAQVSDIGVRFGAPGARGFRSNQALPFHTDRCDYVGLLCVRNALSGGWSRIVSSPAVHNEMLRRRPDLAEALYQQFYMSWQGDEAPGSKPYYAAPIFGIRDGLFSLQLGPSYIRVAQEKWPELPRLTASQIEAMTMLQEIAAELELTAPFAIGDIQFLNNHVTMHGRTAFEDDEDPAKRRMLLRLWLSSPIGRPLPREAETLWGAVEPGQPRGGVPAKDGWWRNVLARDRTGRDGTLHLTGEHDQRGEAATS